MYDINADSLINIDLPWPPSVNHYYGHRAIGKRVIKYVKKEGKVFKAAVKEIIRPAILEHCNQHFMKPAKLAVCLHIYPPDRRRRDVDNLNKATLDALEDAGVYDNDCQIEQLMLVRHFDEIVKNGKISMVIATIKMGKLIETA